MTTEEKAARYDEIESYIKTVVDRNNEYLERNYRVVDLSDLVIKTEIKGQKEILDNLLKILYKENENGR